MREPAWPELLKAAQHVGKQVSGNGGLRHLKGNGEPGAYDLAADVDQPDPESRRRPLVHRIRQHQSALEVAEVVGECVQLETDSIMD